MSVKTALAGGGGGGGGVSGLSTADGGNAIADNEIIRGDGAAGIQGSSLTLHDTDGTITQTTVNGGFSLAVNGTGQLDTTATQLRLGGVTSSFPALKVRPGTNQFVARVADDTENTWIWALAQAASPGASFTAYSAMFDAGMSVRSGLQYLFSSDSGDALQATDTGLARDAAGDVRVTNGSTGIGRMLAQRKIEANTAGSGAPNVLVANESRKLLTNEGATAENHHTLPAAAAGLEFIFVVQDADGIQVNAAAGDTIRIGATVSASGGFISSTTIGDVVTLVAINATEWVATSFIGTWTFDI